MENSPQVLFEDEHLLAINKPSGMIVNRGFVGHAPTAQGTTLQDWVESLSFWPASPESNRGERRPGSASGMTAFWQRSGIVHRLDKETSGVLLIAKTPEAFAELQRQFKARETEKVYVGLVHGRVEPEKGEIDAPIGRNPKVRTKFAVVESGRQAFTEYRVIANFSSRGEEFSLVEFYPKTGRTHQIRVHAKHIGHPIVSDYLYAGRKTARRDRKWCPRLFLHAQKLTFTHPTSDKRITVEAPLPHELHDILASFKTANPDVST